VSLPLQARVEAEECNKIIRVLQVREEIEEPKEAAAVNNLTRGKAGLMQRT
jgi:hypothetical protein